ncbi:MAG TPA: ATP-binding protein, partial [Bryobacteraceae bacterium]|nr:ATP-binding protein [Bryobacteraceae bacterium]
MADRLAEANRQLALSNTRLDQANRELESFAYSMAHDLQEPLRMIGISSELLQVEYAERLDEKANEFLSRCVQGARRMDTFIRDLLIYVRATSTETELPRSLVNLNELASRVLANLEGARVESGSEITVGNLPALIVEETRIQQLLQNLIGNAIRYRRAEVKPRIRVSAERGDGLWTFSVADNGIGIDPEDCERVFAPFKRLSGTHSPGSGLGLAICRRIVERHGGRIWVEPAPGHGSVFRFTLPGAET